MCRKGLATHFDADDVFLITKQGLDFFHDHFDYPYPFGKYDQAFVPEYNLGAMENPGLRHLPRGVHLPRQGDTGVVRGPGERHPARDGAHVVRRPGHHGVVGRPVAEGVLRRLHGRVRAGRGDPLHQDGWITFANRRKAWAYRADQLPSTHPVTADIRDLEDAKLNFDGITYAKGASVLKQLVAYVGRDAFLEGARRYFKRHAYGNTRLGDLLSVLEETSGRDMAAWSRAWLQTAGVNSLTPQVLLDADGPDRRAGDPPGGAGVPPRAAAAPGGGRPVPAGGRGRRWSGTRAPRWTSTGRARSSASWRAPRRPSWCWSTTRT